MTQEKATITSFRYVTKEILEVSFAAGTIARHARPGQFVNIRVDEYSPLLRRPFSIYSVKEDQISIVFNIIGKGTKRLAAMKKGETLDVIGPCGNSFMSFIEGEYDTAAFVAGGIGIAPFPFFTQQFNGTKNIVTYIGGRNKELIFTTGLKNTLIASDDGSVGLKGTVLDLIKNDLQKSQRGRIRFFTCGPTRMMNALSEFANSIGADCYASLETDMACGIGLCQGCNVEIHGGNKKYMLVCKEGTIFDMKTVKLS